MIDMVRGINAYAATATRSIDVSPAAQAPGASFTSLVGNLVTNARDAGAAAELEAAKTVAGKGDLVRTAAAVNDAELAIETLVAVRDRMVGAYNDVMRMQI